MHLILSSSGEKSTTPAPPACLLEDPFVSVFHWGPLAVHEREFGDEVSHNLSLYSCSRTILYVEFTQLHCL